jgi:hypothetical protein
MAIAASSRFVRKPSTMKRQVVDAIEQHAGE